MTQRLRKRYRVPSRQQIVLLRTLLGAQSELHGYPLMKATGLRQATLYGLLKKLHGEGYLDKSQDTVNGRCRIHYGLSEAGVHYAKRALLEDELERAVTGLETS